MIVNSKEEKKKEFANYFFENGIYQLDRALDAYWGKVSNEIFLPGLLSIYDKLVEQKRTFNTPKNWWGDADGYLYYIPNDNRKVIVFTTQNRDYLFIMSPMEKVEYFPDAEDGNSIGNTYMSHSLHIRQVWRKYKKGIISDESKILKNINNALDAVEELSEYADDHSQYPQRPSLDLYDQIDFDLDEYHDKPRFYGDLRDPGFILSSNDRFGMRDADGTKYSHYELEMLLSCNLGCMAAEVGAEVPHQEKQGR